jgi:hypothetical protein
MPEVPDLSADREALETAFRRELRGEVSECLAHVVAWTHARTPTNSPYRAVVFQRERGSVYAKVVDGRPRDPRGVMVFGLDATGRSRIEREYREDGSLVWETVVRYEDSYRTYVTYSQTSDGAWAAEHASLERWEGERPLSVATMTVYDPGVSHREDYVYDADHVVEIIDSRALPMDNGGYRRSWRVEYAGDGKPAALMSEGEVVWRRRAGSAEFGRALRSAEQSLVTAVHGALRQAGASVGLVLVLHQEDGVWSDQALPEIAVPSATDAAEPPDHWLPAEWPSFAMEPDDQAQVEESLTRLDAFGVPRDDEATVLLRIVAQRVRALERQTRGAEIRIVVTGYDPPDLLDDIRRAAERS